jgi:Na+/melibiose symporter-like transporter
MTEYQGIAVTVMSLIGILCVLFDIWCFRKFEKIIANNHDIDDEQKKDLIAQIKSAYSVKRIIKIFVIVIAVYAAVSGILYLIATRL